MKQPLRLREPRIEKLSLDNIQDVFAGNGKTVTYASVSAFKGLENDYIVLTDIEELQSEWWQAVVYVGMSRARLGLFLLIHEKAKSVFEAKLRSWATGRDAGRQGGG